MRGISYILTPLVRGILTLLCKVDARALLNIPAQGPCIVAMNHVNFLEVPLAYAWLFPRDSAGIVKKETRNSPLFRFLAFAWDAIYLDRDSPDLKAMERALDALAKGRILLIAPEGTRSKTGILQAGKPGVVLLALRSGAPVYPLAHTGGEAFWSNFRRGRRTQVRFAVGSPFRIVAHSYSKSERRQMTDEVMIRIATLLPTLQRGVYADRIPKNSEEVSWIKDLPPKRSHSST